MFIAFYNEYWTSEGEHDKYLLNFVTGPWFHDNRETDLITKILSKYTKTVDDEHEVTVRWYMSVYDMYTPWMINVWTTDRDPILYGNGKIYLVTKTWHC